MKKQMMIMAIMSIAIAMAGCGSVNGTGPVNSAFTTTTAAVSAEESSSAESSSVEETTDSKPSESKTDEKEKDEKKSDVSKAESTAESIAETPVPQGKAAANADVSEILGEWVEAGSGLARFITVNSDGTFEAFTNYETLASGYITVDTAGGVKKYSFFDEKGELWYPPFVYSCDDGYEMISGEDYPAIGAVAFCRKEEERTPSPVFEAIAGKWYEEDADIGRTIEVTSYGTYCVCSGDVALYAGTISAESSDGITYYTFTDTDRNIWYTFWLDNKKFPELISFPTDINDTMVAFSHEPSSVRSSEAMSKIVGTWYADDTGYPALVVNDDGTYTMLADDGSVGKSNIVKVAIRNGVEKYTFKDDMLGTWLVPFEVRGDVLVTEDNPVYGIISYRR